MTAEMSVQITLALHIDIVLYKQIININFKIRVLELVDRVSLSFTDEISWTFESFFGYNKMLYNY